MGMIGLDNWSDLSCAKWSNLVNSLIYQGLVNAKSFTSKVAGIVSPFFGAKDLTLAYALA
jgi:hypothetical protein